MELSHHEISSPPPPILFISVMFLPPRFLTLPQTIKARPGEIEISAARSDAAASGVFLRRQGMLFLRAEASSVP
ncbi:hypothetical protein RRG08_052513 [Elysia crispata]|uniref:Uncharacterized protein n=1 Tax=Elysia crispata TaxID=231223 RepID=A0AAE0ZGX0_9GAST|nr:hypothetical protein RRG08_052513 [Elysia crispata]